jgi:hypothetical protein
MQSSLACEAVVAEWCSGNTWSDEVIVATTAVCWSALALLRGPTCKEPMNRGQACEGRALQAVNKVTRGDAYKEIYRQD